MRKESKGEDCALGHGQLRVVAGTAACIGGNVCSNNCLCGRFWRQKHSVARTVDVYWKRKRKELNSTQIKHVKKHSYLLREGPSVSSRESVQDPTTVQRFLHAIARKICGTRATSATSRDCTGIKASRQSMLSVSIQVAVDDRLEHPIETRSRCIELSRGHGTAQ